MTTIAADEFIRRWSTAEFDLASSGWLPIIRNIALQLRDGGLPRF
jgi:hypothetical protein